MALNSCEAAEGIENSISVDRFSNLPDEIAHNIMKGLSFKDLTCLGCVSKRCKTLQLSTPFIDLEPCGENVGDMLDSFNNFMIQRGDNKIKSFYFGYSDDVESPTECYEKFRLSAWINSAMRCNVEELDVHLYPRCDPDVLFTFPSALFLLGSLKYLSLFMKCVIGGEVSLSPLSNLESLNLAYVSVIDESFWRWISCSCKRLQTLFLKNIYGSNNIIIESPSLKTVKVSLCMDGDCCNLSICANRLEDISIDWGYTSSNNSVNIFAPKLKFFSWGGGFPSHQNLREMRFLKEGRISLFAELTQFATLVDVLRSMRCVKTLKLNDHVLKALSKDGFMFAPLNEVRCLKVRCFLTDDLVPGLVRLLQRTPSLREMCLNSYSYKWKADLFNYGGCDMEFWKQQRLAFVNCIKRIAIALDRGSNAFEFARYILKHARNLERMDIICPPNLYDEVMKLQDEMISSGTLIFHQVLADGVAH